MVHLGLYLTVCIQSLFVIPISRVRFFGAIFGGSMLLYECNILSVFTLLCVASCITDASIHPVFTNTQVPLSINVNKQSRVVLVR
jgi:hypothetical protein